MNGPGRIHVGTSGYSFADCVGPFYPKGTPGGDFLPFYARHFGCVEVNSTYYRIPQPRNMAAMAKRAEGRLEFAVKAHQDMTHARDKYAGALPLFKAALAPLRERGFLGLGSGSITHTLRDFVAAWHDGGETPAYVRDFADWVAARIADADLPALLDYRRQAPSAVRAHPSEEHLLPLFVALGAAGGTPRGTRVHAGIDDRVIAMDAYAFESSARSLS